MTPTVTPKRKISNLEELRQEQVRLREQELLQREIVKADMRYVKEEFSLGEIASKALGSIVPQAVRHSAAVNAPINFIARAIFGKNHNVVSEYSDRGKANKIRNVVLGLAEGTAAYMIAKAIRRRI